MEINSKLTRTRVAWGILGVLLAVWGGSYVFRSCTTPPLPATQFFDSSALKATAILPALESEAPAGKNLVWCASFLCGWKALENDLAKGPIALEGSPAMLAALQNAADPRPSVPEESLYVAAGWNDKGIVERVTAELAAKFPGKAAPTFPGITPTSFVAYAYLEARVKFALPYFQSRGPLEFTDGHGVKTKVRSFGIRGEDDYAYEDLRRQAGVLYASKRWSPKPFECVVDLDRESQPNQVIVAMLNTGRTLSEKLAAVEEKIAAAEEEEGEGNGYGLGPTDVLLVPDIAWSISHHHAELEGRRVENGPLKGQRLDVVQQDIQFRLDRSGAEVRSEWKSYCMPIATFYVLNRPFLVCMRKRGAKTPFFALWVDNAELLNKW